MEKKLKVVFFGTPDFAVEILKSIYQSSHQIVGVVTTADKPSGRGQKLNFSPVKKFAVENHLPLFQPEKLRDEDFLTQIKNLNADIFVVVAFRMMPKILYQIPSMGTFNLHASLLPEYRGAAPINYAIINGETQTGVTTFFINEKIDEGEILLQRKIEIDSEENAGTLHDKLAILGADLVVETLDKLYLKELKPTPQGNQGVEKLAYKIFKENMRIDWSWDLDKIHNFVRGLSPYPCAFTHLLISDEMKNFKIFNGKKVFVSHHFPVGEVQWDKNEFKIYTKEGYYSVLEVQLEGKKRVLIKDFLNGFQPNTEVKAF